MVNQHICQGFHEGSVMVNQHICQGFEGFVYGESTICQGFEGFRLW